ncbi:YihY family inner membrane protein [Helicobacter kayseriensis]|uniref:YihY family inner membrane protein n=1 Tax=Helicobacter kayseriensis TaxID=2905877 RepID=UPI001E50E745|nr:YihY family inner membrane protein [Helicobacter kayseriensis]MCE3046710.1 YihY family inner membrane protein [Helicobacter kayseriensis]MCE3047988.1 YihY family inner membrane protein [Helicobacter kayseriensis]
MLKRLYCKAKALYSFLTHEDELFVYAASLSFYTVFAFIPLLLIVLSILLLLPNFQNTFLEIKDFVLSNVLPTHSEIVARFLDPLLIQSSKMGILGFIYILFTSILFFRNYEYITSKVFGSSPRTFFDSLSLYWMIVSLFPLLFGVLFYFVFQFRKIWESYIFLPYLLQLAPIMVGWMMFLFLFKISANKKLNPQALFFATFLTSLGWNIAKWSFVYYVAHNRSYETIYGSVSFVLFGMLWIYVSWLIVLFGMRVCEGIHRKKS